MKTEDYFSKGFKSEFHTIFKDYGILLVLIIALFAYPLTYQYAYKNGTATDIPVAVFDKDNSSTSRTVTRMIKATNNIDVVLYETLDEAKRDLKFSKIRAIVIVEEDLEKHVMGGATQGVVSVYVDGTNLLISKNVLMSVSKAVYTFSAKVQVKKVLSKVGSMDQALSIVRPVEFVSQKLFNTKQYYDSYIMPSITLLLIQQTLLLGICIIGGTKRERKEHLKGLSFTKSTLYMLGRSSVYAGMALINSTIALALFANVFGYQFNISLIDMYALLIPYILGTTFLGMLLSNLFTQRETPVLFLVFVSPLLLFMSGVSWPKELIPNILVYVFTLFPSNAMIPAYNSMSGMGSSLAQVKGDLSILYVLAIAYFLLASIAIYRVNRE